MPTENVKPEDLQPLRQRSLQSQPSTGKKRVETDMERKVRVKLLLVEQEIARERRDKEEKEKKEAARLAREQGTFCKNRSDQITAEADFGSTVFTRRSPLRFHPSPSPGSCLTEKNEAAARRAAKNAKKRAAAREKAALAKESAKAKALAEQEERLRIFDQLTACAKLHNPDEYYGALDKVKQGIVDNNISVVGWAKTSLPNDIEKQDRNVDGGGTTLLHLAVQASDSDLVDWLCERGKFNAKVMNELCHLTFND